MEYITRLANENDTKAIIDLYKELRDTPGWNDMPDFIEDYPSIKNVEEDLQNKSLYCLVNENNDILAVGVLAKDDELVDVEIMNKSIVNPCELARFGVAKKMHNKGVGTTLLKYMINEARSLNYDCMRILVAGYNIPAISLYEKLGSKFVKDLEMFNLPCKYYELKFEDKTDETINTYNSVVNEYIDYFNSKDLKGNVQFQREIDVVVDALANGSRILDVGTATGDYPKYLTEKCDKNFEVIGIDASKNMIDVAIKKASKASFKVMDMRKLDFPQNYFDAIICLATLIHVNDETAKEILANFDLLLKPNGIIIINVMEYINGEKELYGKEPFNPKYNTYFNRYNKEFFIDWFLGKGYEILNIFDNPLFNAEKVKEPTVDTNQFSIIIRKI